MATATKKIRAAKAVAHAGHEPAVGSPLEFLVNQGNGGDYHWEIVAGDGATLAKCGGFTSHEEAQGAARRIHEGAGGARFDTHVAEERPLVAL